MNVINKYILPATINTSTGLKVVDIMCFATPVRSSRVTVLAKDVPFNNFDWPADKNKIKKLASKYGLKVVKVSQGSNYEPTAVLKGDEKKLIKFLSQRMRAGYESEKSKIFSG